MWVYSNKERILVSLAFDILSDERKSNYKDLGDNYFEVVKKD